MECIHSEARDQGTAERRSTVERGVEQDGAPGVIPSNRGEFGPR